MNTRETVSTGHLALPPVRERAAALRDILLAENGEALTLPTSDFHGDWTAYIADAIELIQKNNPPASAGIDWS